MKLTRDEIPEDEAGCECGHHAARHNSNIGRCKDCGCQRFVEDFRDTLPELYLEEDTVWDL